MKRSIAVLGAVLAVTLGLVALAWMSERNRDEPAIAAASDAADTDASDTVSSDTVASDTDRPSAGASGTPSVAIDLALSEPPEPIDPDCTLTERLELGDEDDQVACLESQLIAAGVLQGTVPDRAFDDTTDAAVRSFQEQRGLVVDGVIGPQTASELGVWSGPSVLPPDADTCPKTGRSAVVDRFNQRAWLCESGSITEEMPITTALSQPDPGTYEVYAKDVNASSSLSGEYSEMRYFVAFTYGKYQGARIAFHSVPTYTDGSYVQTLDSVGTQELFGASAGCIRVLPDDAKLIWDWLDVGDTVTVVT